MFKQILDTQFLLRIQEMERAIPLFFKRGRVDDLKKHNSS